MDFFANLMSGMTDRFGPMAPLLAVGLLGLLLILMALPIVMKRQRDRFRELKDQAPKAANDKKRALRKTDRVDKLEKFAQFLEPQKKEELSAAKLTMLRAGYSGKNAVRMFHAIQFLLAILFLIGGLLVALVKSFSQEMTMTDLLLYSLLPCAVGYYIPRYWVNKRVEQRKTEIIQGFPDALDLMLVCVEAGQSLDQSIIRVGKESRAGYPALADEFDMVAQEVKAGKERISVLKDMAERVGVPDVASFVTTIIQSATFGTSVADALRVYSADMRDKRIMRAEEKANMLPTKLTLGTMLFTVPPLLVILIGPSIYGMVTMLGQLASGL
ncbi:type II secretion system F family protein [Tabrizicola sp.]|jgi:tight adherence protein C|uniref:type II secretion system F family protein n=1 Tax=Tabrizicola sp. TaxID=2005166 RepID=UPI000BD0004A|nr:type II secretion system F family protein [Tabrizicola sp.]MBY0351501.1 type II secretion system F family protein [Tabrizicola sp.]MDK2773699.1 type II secretion system F family protein [Tabrizicola sp.]OYX19706.1 MAG: pilus assembly protein TadC [Rhodobacterales bacterium 32-66-9]